MFLITQKFFVSALLVAQTSSQTCDPNYEGACVPMPSIDVDCKAGRGDGPDYVAGPVFVVGLDPHGLDRDKDGIGCELG